MSRRGAGEGSVYKDGDSWVASVEVGRDPSSGKRRRGKVKAKTKSEVLRKAKVLRNQIESGVTPDGSLTVGTFLNRWLDAVITSRVGADRTVTDYRGALAHVIAALGKVPLNKLTPDQVDRFLEAKAAEGLSRSYVARMRMLLADALTHAQGRGLVLRNAAALSVIPKCKPKPERKPYDANQVARLLDAAREERLHALVVTGLVLGLRPGELTGLQWPDLDLDSTPPTLTVTGSIKRDGDGRLYRGAVKRSTAGVRTLAIPATLAGALRDHRRAQAEERLAIGGLWQDHGLVFPSEVGTPLDPSRLRRTFRRIAGRAGLDGFPYLMRHSVVSLLLDNGATIDEIADLTGDDPATLYRHYRHRVQPVSMVAANRMPNIPGA
jgi:integrase